MSVFISVIIPVYNKEKSVESAIRSVFSQSYKKIELIVIDDGSTDSSCNIVRKITENVGCARLISRMNMGVSVARNYGASKASYEYIAFLDADDLWHPDYLKNMAAALTAHPETKWVASNYERFVGIAPALICESMTLSLSDFKYVNYFEESCRIKGKQSIIHSDSFIVKKDFFFSSGSYPVGVSASEDYDLYFRMARFADPLWTEKILTFYREDAENQLSKMLVDSRLPPYLTSYFSYSLVQHRFLKELRLRTLYNLLNKSILFGGAGSFGSRFRYVKLIIFISLSPGSFSVKKFFRYFRKALIFCIYPRFFKLKAGA